MILSKETFFEARPEVMAVRKLPNKHNPTEWELVLRNPHSAGGYVDHVYLTDEDLLRALNERPGNDLDPESYLNEGGPS